MKKFTVPKPCHENWENMLPEEKGRFCTSCKTKVYDFTKSSDQEIQEIYDLENGNICGKFGNDQVLHFTKFQNAVLRIERFTQNNFSKFGILVSAVSLLMGISGCTKKIESHSANTNGNPDSSNIISDDMDSNFVLGEPVAPREDSAQIPNQVDADYFPQGKIIAIIPKKPVGKPVEPIKVPEVFHPPTMGVPIYVKDTTKPKKIIREGFPLGKIAPVIDPKVEQKTEKTQTDPKIKEIDEVRVVGIVRKID